MTSRPETIRAALNTGDRLFLNSGLGPEFVTGQLAAIEAAADAQVAQIVTISVRGAKPGALLGGGLHGEVDDTLRASGIPSTILAPVGFLQNLPAEVSFTHGEGTFHGSYGEGPTGYIDARDIAAVAAVLLAGEIGENRTLELTGAVAPTHGDLAAAISAVVGRPVRYVDHTIDEMVLRLVGQGLPEPVAIDLATLMAEVGDGRWATTTTAVQDVTGRRPRSVADFLADYASSFT